MLMKVIIWFQPDLLCKSLRPPSDLLCSEIFISVSLLDKSRQRRENIGSVTRKGIKNCSNRLRCEVFNVTPPYNQHVLNSGGQMRSCLSSYVLNITCTSRWCTFDLIIPFKIPKITESDRCKSIVLPRRGCSRRRIGGQSGHWRCGVQAVMLKSEEPGEVKDKKEVKGSRTHSPFRFFFLTDQKRSSIC